MISSARFLSPQMLRPTSFEGLLCLNGGSDYMGVGWPGRRAGSFVEMEFRP